MDHKKVGHGSVNMEKEILNASWDNNHDGDDDDDDKSRVAHPIRTSWGQANTTAKKLIQKRADMSST